MATLDTPSPTSGTLVGEVARGGQRCSVPHESYVKTRSVIKVRPSRAAGLSPGCSGGTLDKNVTLIVPLVKRMLSQYNTQTVSCILLYSGLLITCIKSFIELKVLDTIGICKRLAFIVGVSQHMHKITNLWKFELNRSSNFRDNNDRKNTLVTRSCVRLDSWFRDLKSCSLRSRNQIRGKFLLSWKLWHFREGVISHNVLYHQPLPSTGQQERFYANNYFEWLPTVPTAFKGCSQMKPGYFKRVLLFFNWDFTRWWSSWLDFYVGLILIEGDMLYQVIFNLLIFEMLHCFKNCVKGHDNRLKITVNCTKIVIKL